MKLNTNKTSKKSPRKKIKRIKIKIEILTIKRARL